MSSSAALSAALAQAQSHLRPMQRALSLSCDAGKGKRLKRMKCAAHSVMELRTGHVLEGAWAPEKHAHTYKRHISRLSFIHGRTAHAPSRTHEVCRSLCHGASHRSLGSIRQCDTVKGGGLLLLAGRTALEYSTAAGFHPRHQHCSVFLSLRASLSCSLGPPSFP